MAKGDSFNNPLDIRLVNGRLFLNNNLNQDKQLAFYRFRLNRASNFTARLIGLRGDQDADLTLFDPDTNEIVKSDNEENRNELIQEFLRPGTYIVRVNRIDGEPNFQLRLFTTADAGNTFQRATSAPVRAGQRRGSFVFDDIVSPQDRLDIYQITVAARSRLDVVLGSLQRDADLTLFDGRFRRIGISTKEGTASDSISQVVGAGTYYVRVSLSNRSTDDDDDDDDDDDNNDDQNRRTTGYKLKIGFIQT